jgi:hypothetical protein
MAVTRKDLAEKIASLRGDYGQYMALDAEMYDGRVSGIGIGRWFNREQLCRALGRLRLEDQRLKRAGRTCQPAIRFLLACIQRLPAEQNRVYVDFG